MKRGGCLAPGRQHDEMVLAQESGAGYVDYAQIGLRLWGVTTPPRLYSHPEHHVTVYGVNLHFDSGAARRRGSYGALLSTPYFLAGLETHWKTPSAFGAEDAKGKYLKELAEKLYLVQEKRYEIEGISTARTDHPLNRPPYFLQDSIYAGGYPWSTMSDTGQNMPELALVSTRAVFAMWALWKTPYADHLMDIIDELYDEQRGWLEGRYESTGDYERIVTITTNTMVLEALTYKATGALFEMPEQNVYLERKLSDEFFPSQGCLPELER